MADTPEQTPAAGGSGEEQQASAKAKGGGLLSYLPLVIVVVLMPVLAWVVMEFKSKKGSAGAAAAATEHTESAKEEAPKKAESAGGHGSSKEQGKKAGKGERNTKLPVPLTRDAIAYRAKEDKEGDYDKVVVLDLKGEPRDEAKSDKIIVNIAGTGGTRFAVARLSLVGEHQDLIGRVNQNRERLLDVASGVLSSKALDDVEKAGFRNILRAELLAYFNEILGRGTLQEVIITEFVIQ